MTLHASHPNRYTACVNTSQGKSALVLLAAGAEEIEFTVIVDVLRRAKISVTAAGIAGDGPVTCSRGVRILPDVALADVTSDFDAVILPGGAAGAAALAASSEVGQVLTQQWQRGGIVAAICAAPIALLRHGIALGANLTHYPGSSAELAGHYHVTGERVCVSGNLITGIGPGASFEFALALIRALAGDAVADATQGPLLLG
jgi:protein DJ-1